MTNTMALAIGLASIVTALIELAMSLFGDRSPHGNSTTVENGYDDDSDDMTAAPRDAAYRSTAAAANPEFSKFGVDDSVASEWQAVSQGVGDSTPAAKPVSRSDGGGSNNVKNSTSMGTMPLTVGGGDWDNITFDSAGEFPEDQDVAFFPAAAATRPTATQDVYDDDFSFGEIDVTSVFRLPATTTQLAQQRGDQGGAGQWTGFDFDLPLPDVAASQRFSIGSAGSAILPQALVAFDDFEEFEVLGTDGTLLFGAAGGGYAAFDEVEQQQRLSPSAATRHHSIVQRQNFFGLDDREGHSEDVDLAAGADSFSVRVAPQKNRRKQLEHNHDNVDHRRHSTENDASPASVWPLILLLLLSILVAWLVAAQFATAACTLSSMGWPILLTFLVDGTVTDSCTAYLFYRSSQPSTS